MDKTAIALKLIREGKHYFLSRPRRFGKDLFLDTLKELFEGHEALFQGLAVHPHWYNGYNWLSEGVYNPFDILHFFRKRPFGNYWFETGTPSFLVNLLFKRQVTSLSLDQTFTSTQVLSSFDIEDIATEALLFQTGYLTIKQAERIAQQDYFHLGFPNLEVRQSLNESLLSILVKDKSKQAVNSAQLYRLLLKNDFDSLKQLLHAFYASVFYSYFAALGLDVTVEDASNLGRLDMALKFNQQVYLFEFKVVNSKPRGKSKALQQLQDRHYADKYRHLKQPIYLIGVEFSKKDRNIVGFAVEQG